MPALTVAENVFLGSQPTTRSGLIDWKTDAPRRRRASARARHRHRRRPSPLRTLSLGGQQLVEIARVVFSGASIIVLDEPTSALSGPEAKRLFAAMRELKARGTSLVFISHFLEDVLAVSDRVTVLKNSRKVATLPNEGLTKHHLIQLMIGRDAETLAESYEGGVRCRRRRPRTPVLEVEGLSLAGSFTDVSFDARPGEILGIFGNLGAGMTEVARVAVRPGAPDVRDDAARRASRSRRRRRGRRSDSASPISPRTGGRRIFPRHEIFKNITLAHLEEIVGGVIRQSRRSGHRRRSGQADGRAAAESEPGRRAT